MTLRTLLSWLCHHRRKLLPACAGLAAALVVVSCATTRRTLVAPPGIAGATFVGSKSCEECHANISRGFSSATHARLQAEGPNATEVGCESCHGPGSLHNQAGGGRDNIINPKRSPEACFACHLDLRGRFSLPYHHPIEDGKVTCTDCHDPHQGPAIKSGGTQMAAENETCLRCHPQQRGPFVFEHEASREGCLTCHNPHGSVNQKLLTERNSNLCLKCHFQQPVPGTDAVLIGGFPHAGRLRQGTCWSAGCHEAVHGSQVHSSLRY